MEEPELIEKLKIIKEKYTFDFDKLDIDEDIKAVKKAIVRADMLKYDPIKDLVALMKRMVEEIRFGLGNDRGLSTEDRDKMFERRDAFQWLISFFETPKSTITTIEKKVEEELKEEP